MEPIRIGDRVRVINRRLVHSGQRGTVIGADAGGGFYVHLDYDGDRPDAGTFFHAEELEVLAHITPPADRSRGDAESLDTGARH